MNIKQSIILRVRIAYIAMALLALMIVVKLCFVMFVNNDFWLERAEKANIRLREIKATRGNIYSDNGSLMATSLPFYTLAFDPSVSLRDAKRKAIYNTELDSLCLELSRFFKDKSKDSYKQLFTNARKRGRQYIRLSGHLINHHEKKIMSNWPLFRHGQMNGGVIFEKIDKRFIPFGHLAGRTVGYCKTEVGVGGIPKKRGAGLEYSFDSLLAGKNGKALFAKMSGGGWKQLHTEDEVKPVHGLDIQTTIDVNLQDVAEETLLEALIEHQANYGCVVLMEVKTGAIKAMANLSRIKSGPNEGMYVENYNHAVGTNIEPGSTIKLATMMAVMEEGDIELTDTVFIGNGSFKVYEKVLYDDHANEPVLTVQQVFERSSNIGVAKLALQTFGKNPKDQQRFVNYLIDFGLNKPLNFQISGEAKPKIKSPDDDSWSGISLPWMAHGYGLEVSPMHLLTMYNAIANDGVLLRPLLVDNVRYADKIVEKYEPEIINKKICSKETNQKLRAMLEGVVERGTASNIRTSAYKIAGKTGTAQKFSNGSYSKEEYLASFVGYFPADKPKYSCIVVVDHPKTGVYYGNLVAAPVFRKIADKVFAVDLQLHKVPKYNPAPKGVFPVVQSGKYSDLKVVCKEIGVSNWGNDLFVDDYVKASRNDELKTIQWNKVNLAEDLVPDVSGMTLKDALYLLENLGLKVFFSGNGRVKEQSLAPGYKVGPGKSITLKLG